MPEISVIVPVYQVEPYLSRCIESVLRQSISSWELILVDDGSPDSCPAICDSFAEKDKRIHVIHRENGGLSAARNSGLDWVMAHSESQWIFFLDSDDWIHGDCLKILLQAVKTSGAQIGAGSLLRVSRMQEDQPFENPKIEVLKPEQAYVNYYIQCMTACAKLISRELLEEVRFPVGKLHEDCFVTHIPVFHAGKIAILQAPVYYYYFNPQSITRKTWSPKRLEELQAHEVRLSYLQEHGYREAGMKEKQVTGETIYEQIEVLAQLRDSAYRGFLRDLRHRLRKLLKEEKGLIPLNGETFWMYLMAWPGKPVWYVLKSAQVLWHRIRKTDI